MQYFPRRKVNCAMHIWLVEHELKSPVPVWRNSTSRGNETHFFKKKQFLLTIFTLHSKCVQCMFTLKGNAVTDPGMKANTYNNTLSEVESVTYLGVIFSNNAKWIAHVEDIFRKCVRLSFFVKKLLRLPTPADFIRKFVETCVIPLILYCSPAIFPELLKHDFALLKRSIKLLSQVSGLNFSYLTNLLCERAAWCWALGGCWKIQVPRLGVYRKRPGHWGDQKQE